MGFADYRNSLGLITGGSIADTLGWRWSQYIVAIIDGGVLVLLLLSFEETLFPRFLFAGSQSSRRDTSVSGFDSDRKPTQTTIAANPEISHDFPKKNFVERLKLWTYYPEDRTTYWQYFRRPFFLLSFPNVIIVSTQLLRRRSPC